MLKVIIFSNKKSEYTGILLIRLPINKLTQYNDASLRLQG